MKKTVIRISEIATTKHRRGRLPVSPATIWRWVREGRFPKPFKLGVSVTMWDADEVESFISQQSISGRTLTQAESAPQHYFFL